MASLANQRGEGIYGLPSLSARTIPSVCEPRAAKQMKNSETLEKAFV
jgi:hypothetical protein